MRKLMPVLAVTAAMALFTIPTRAQDKVELFGGYSYLRPPVTQTETFVCTGPVCPLFVPPPLNVTTHPNLSGWEFSGAYKLTPWLGARADFSGHYGSALAGSSTHLHTFLFGPEVRLPARISPFAHVLIGGAHASTGTASISNNPPYNTVASGSDTAFAMALGAGWDVKLTPFLWLRPIQMDYLITRLHSATQNQPRASAGVVLHF